MKRSIRLLACPGVILLVALGIYFEPTYGVRGWLWNEAYFDGRPTSWWRAELDNWEISVQPMGKRTFVSYHRKYSWFDGVWQRMAPPPPLPGSLILEQEGPVLGLLTCHEPDAIAVLQELRDDRSLKIRQFARHGLGLDAEDAE